MSRSDREVLLRHIRRVSRDEGIDHVLDEYDVDVVIGSADSPYNLLVCGSST